VSIGANNLAVIFPADAHAPLMGDGKIKKAVFKVMVERPKESFLER
jgi:beta-galactosidase beta subunit